MNENITIIKPSILLYLIFSVAGDIHLGHTRGQGVEPGGRGKRVPTLGAEGRESFLIYICLEKSP